MVVAIGGRARGYCSLPARIALLVVIGLSSSQAISWATPGRLEQAKDRALNYFATQVRTADPGWLSLFGYLHRRFGLEARLASGAIPHHLKDGVGRPEVFAIYRRMDDPSATITKQQIADLPTAIDRITASALHCDRIPVPDDWIEILRKGSAAGAYALTHSVAATEWTVENGCRTRADVAALQHEQITLLVRFIEQRHELAGRFDAVTDMWIEAIDMLYYIGARERVQSAWIDEILAIQRDDGGWPRHPRAQRSDPHATALAIWVLLENLHPNTPRISWIRQR